MGHKVVLGLSGGVDSAVAALLLREQGYEVLGLYLDNGFPGVRDASEAAEGLGIPLTVRDIRPELEKYVCAPFAESYLRGETPNPCILCNPAVKLRALADEAERTGAEHIATGHYAIAKNGGIFRGQPENDQSYMLCRLTEDETDRLLLPLGAYRKTEVRAMAQRAGLECAAKPDSMEICFIPDGDYARWIEGRGTVPPEGDFVLDGRVVGRHRGIHRYTVGQGRHLGQGFGRKVWVSAIERETNRVYLSDDGAGMYRKAFRVRDIHWLVPPETDERRCGIRIRHSRAALPMGTVKLEGSMALVTLDTPLRAPTPGQTAAFYDGDRLLGGGFITANLSSEEGS